MKTRGNLGLPAIFVIASVTPALGGDRAAGHGRWWHGEGKEEFWNGPCTVKIEAKRDEYKEEVKCD